jgi:type II secretory pathway predicted ATPase ExeA
MNKLLSTYGLTREPFTKDIAPSEMLQTEPLQEALQLLKAAVEGRASAVITGDSGCGKTACCAPRISNLRSTSNPG